MTVATHIDADSAEGMIATFANAVKCIPLMTGNKSEAEYKKALELIEYLVDRDELNNPLFEPLAAKITEYENSVPEFEAFNRRVAEIPTGIAALRTLMDQKGLKAADLEDELGSKSNVSNILNGRRSLTVQHIKALATRFDVPADLFI
ncbi:helix-turn-helix domain-containing protein [Serratia grimesii]|jgi:HTH-type transcriptional regulator/antitoxin HigA|uniref:helix-turn-helix domain-containing protein n=1 Tax=Serratia grimesii TaxID=82995 RepID=UPI00077CB574|nr:helix-turn-helix domain-containing protein [Serratia grimesii]CAI1003044.1 Antitoxin HigA [Serratia grimesii]CAI2480292.1 Antitoxin HigA [Serratia grimesii]SUI31217.1 Antitoxin HigA [Serratia grimesii]